RRLRHADARRHQRLGSIEALRRLLQRQYALEGPGRRHERRLVAVRWSCGSLPRPMFIIFLPHIIATASTTAPSQVTNGTLDAGPHPGFDASTLTNDIGVVFLAAPSTVAPVPYVTMPLDVMAVQGAPRVVGFGETLGGRLDGGAKRTGNTSITDVSPTELNLQ